MRKFKYIQNGKELTKRIQDGRSKKAIEKELGKLQHKIERFEEHTNYYRNSYFWSDNGNSSQRTKKEAEAEYHDSFSSARLDIELKLDFEINMSRQNVYKYKNIEVNGEYMTARTLTTILSEIAEIKAASVKKISALKLPFIAEEPFATANKGDAVLNVYSSKNGFDSGEEPKKEGLSA
jgi:hypothetical protein